MIIGLTLFCVFQYDMKKKSIDYARAPFALSIWGFKKECRWVWQSLFWNEVVWIRPNSLAIFHIFRWLTTSIRTLSRHDPCMEDFNPIYVYVHRALIVCCIWYPEYRGLIYKGFIEFSLINMKKKWCYKTIYMNKTIK